MIFIIIILMVFVVGIIVLNLKTTEGSEQKRMLFLKEVTAFMEGEQVPIPAYRDSYAVRYNYKGHLFLYEDYVDKLTNVTFNRAFLKAHTNTRFTLKFNERIKESVFDRNNLQDILKPKEVNKKNKIKLPSAFQTFDILTNDYDFLNSMFENKKIHAFLKSFVITDERGWSQMALSIREGQVVLEFNTRFGYQPNLIDLQNNPQSLEDYTKKLLVLVDFLNHSFK